jgi:hypothetical protein
MSNSFQIQLKKDAPQSVGELVKTPLVVSVQNLGPGKVRVKDIGPQGLVIHAKQVKFFEKPSGQENLVLGAEDNDATVEMQIHVIGSAPFA